LDSEPQLLEVIESREDGRVRVRLRGELDLATSGLVANRLRELRAGGATVVLDLDQLAFIDASGIGVILAAAADARRDGWAFTVTRGSAVVRRLFELLDIAAYVAFDGEPS
jgi:anti-sigma B factor antagonist